MTLPPLCGVGSFFELEAELPPKIQCVHWPRYTENLLNEGGKNDFLIKVLKEYKSEEKGWILYASSEIFINKNHQNLLIALRFIFLS